MQVMCGVVWWLIVLTWVDERKLKGMGDAQALFIDCPSRPMIEEIEICGHSLFRYGICHLAEY